MNKFNFEKRESFVVKTKASDEELAKFDSFSLISYLIDLHSNRPNDRKGYEKQFLKDCSPHMEEVEHHVKMSIKDFDIIFNDNIDLQANPTSDDATTLVEKAENLSVRTKQFRNSDFPKIIAELIKASNKLEETQITERETPTSWILKRKIRLFQDKNNGMLDQILFQN